MKNIKITQTERDTISEMYSSGKGIIEEQAIKFGMSDSGGSTKIKDLQKKLSIKSSTTGKIVSTGYFGDLTVSALKNKVPNLYSGKNDVIDDAKYKQIMTTLGGQSSNQNTQQNVQTTQNTVKNIDFNSLWTNFPKATANVILPGVLPNFCGKNPDSCQNACATRLSLALNNLGFKPPAQFRSEADFNLNGILYKKGSPLTVRAKDTPSYLTQNFGSPTLKFPNTQENINKYLNGKKGMFVITGAFSNATGHVDIFQSTGSGFNCGKDCHFGEGGTIQVWLM